ncbi:MAG: DUF2764 family protein [Candidatus Cloacimonetes bacterium]|nr:DUF2764 family protein [Candidatus Cloacimonadota bacterium]
MGKEYYYLVAGLPNITFDDSKLPRTPAELMSEARNHLSDNDQSLLRALFIPVDLDNLINIIFQNEAEYDERGLIARDEWERIIETIREERNSYDYHGFPDLPAFIEEHIRQYLDAEDDLSPIGWEHSITTAFYHWTQEQDNRFINQWFAFNRDLKNIIIALNGKRFGFKYDTQLIGDNEIVEKLIKSSAIDFGLGKQFPLFDLILRVFEVRDILDRERGYDALRWKWIDEQTFFDYFTVDRVLGYMCKLMILARWMALDPAKGRDVFHDTLEELENSFAFPEEFDLKQRKNR